jgi:hypothetical protein
MANTNDARISRLLDQLEKPGLSDEEIARVKEKVEYLQGQQSEQE